MRIAICDDDKQECAGLLESIQNCHPDNRTAEIFTDGTAFLDAAQQVPHFTVVFLDIYMPGGNGIDIAKKMQQISPETNIVFITTSTQHAVEAFSLEALHYLVKPVSKEQIREVFQRIQRIQSRVRPCFSVKVGYSKQMLYFDEVAMITSCDHTIEIRLFNGRSIKTREVLSKILLKLDSSFIQLQRGIIVNMEFIEWMQYEQCVLRNGQTVLLSRKERAKINKMYDDYIFKRMQFEKES